MRIMIVEDEQRARRGLYNLITSIGEEYEIVAQAADGKSALDIIQVVKPDVVFTDIKMPYMDGMALIKTLYTMQLEIKFVIISAYEEFETARQAISLGVKEYLVKPITYDEVKTVLERLELDNGSTAVTLSKLQDRYPNTHPLILKTLAIIEQSYASKIGQEFLASTLGITPEYFSYLFHKDIGQTFSKFLKKYRIEVAVTLLLNNAVTREEVYSYVGFSDPKYFNKVFLEVMGETVVQYLKKMKR